MSEKRASLQDAGRPQTQIRPPIEQPKKKHHDPRPNYLELPSKSFEVIWRGCISRGRRIEQVSTRVILLSLLKLAARRTRKPCAVVDFSCLKDLVLVSTRK